MSFRAVPEAVARLLLETPEKLRAMLGGLNFVPDHVEHAALRPIVGVADLADVLPVRHVRKDLELARTVSPDVVDLA